MNKRLSFAALVVALIVAIPAISIASTGVPTRFFVDFNDMNIVFSPNGGNPQISVGDKVLSYGGDWQVKKLKPYLFHLKQKFWKGFFYKISSSRKVALKVTGGTFGKLGGKSSALKAKVTTVGGGNIRVSFLKSASPYMVVVPKTKSIQVTANANVFNYGTDMTLVQLKPYLYHFKQKFWKNFFWVINTSRKAIYIVNNGTFGRLNRNLTKLPYRVRVVGGQAVAAAAPKSVKVNFNEMQVTFTPNCKTLQVIAASRVLSYGQNFQVKKLKPYLFHVKRSNWQGFYWKVNTSRKELYKVSGGTFGRLGGSERKLIAKVRIIGGGNIQLVLGAAARPYLIFEPAKRGLQVIAHSTALDYGQQWKRIRLKPYLYHLKQNVWKGFHWMVNTSRKEVHLVEKGTFGKLGGKQTKLPFSVTVR